MIMKENRVFYFSEEAFYKAMADTSKNKVEVYFNFKNQTGMIVCEESAEELDVEERRISNTNVCSFYTDLTKYKEIVGNYFDFEQNMGNTIVKAPKEVEKR